MNPLRRQRSTAALAVALAAAASGCASEEGMAFEFATDGERVEVEVHDDGFVVAKEGRMPIEGFVLRLRQHVRALPEEQRGKLLVDIRNAKNSGARAGQWIDWLRDQLAIMQIGQARVTFQ